VTRADEAHVVLRNESHLRTRDLRRLLAAVDGVAQGSGWSRPWQGLTVRTGTFPGDTHVPLTNALRSRGPLPVGWLLTRERHACTTVLWRPGTEGWTPGHLLPLADHRDLLEMLGCLAFVRVGYTLPPRAELLARLEAVGITPRRFPIRVRTRRAAGGRAARVEAHVRAQWHVDRSAQDATQLEERWRALVARLRVQGAASSERLAAVEVAMARLAEARMRLQEHDVYESDDVDDVDVVDDHVDEDDT
jgi:hypothetical protein